MGMHLPLTPCSVVTVQPFRIWMEMQDLNTYETINSIKRDTVDSVKETKSKAGDTRRF